MKKVDCPHCRKSIYSEYFNEGEQFPCPSCEITLCVESADDRGATVSVVIDKLASGIFSRILEGKGILLNQRDIVTFGEVLAAGLDIARWPALPADALEAFARSNAAALAALAPGDPFADVLKLRGTLLDIYRTGAFRGAE